MTQDDFKNRIMNKVYQKAQNIIESKASTLKALFKYEIAVTNTELALRSNTHGYDFKFIPDSYAEHVVISPVKTNSETVKITFSIPSYAFKDATDEEVAFLKDYVLANALQKLKGIN